MVSRISVLGEGKAAKMLARRATGKAGWKSKLFTFKMPFEGHKP